MTRLLALLRGVPASPSRAQTRARGAAAAGRLRAACRSFDGSVAALRKAALDHVDRQDLASTALRANLDRLAQRLGADA